MSLLKKKVYPVNERTIIEYRSNQKEEIFKGAKLNNEGFPLIWPTRDKENHPIFISFVNADIFDLQGNKINDEPINFDILDTEKFDSSSPQAEERVKIIGALFSPDFRVGGGVYVKGKFYTGQMNEKYAKELTVAFMEKYFYFEDLPLIEKYFPKNKAGYLRYAPVYSKKIKRRIAFSAINGRIKERESENVILGGLNFHVYVGDVFDLNKPEDKDICNSLFMVLNNSKYKTRGFYYKGKLIRSEMSDEFRLYLEKSFVKKNFTIEQVVPYLSNYASKDENGYLNYFPMQDNKGRPIQISFRDGRTPFEEEFNNFDIYGDEVFDVGDEKTQKKMQIIYHILRKTKGYRGALYLDGVLLPGKEKYHEIQRRKGKVEKVLKSRIDVDADYLAIMNNFSTDDREVLLSLCDFYHDYYPHMTSVVPRSRKDKDTKRSIVFDNVNFIDEFGKIALEENYCASYPEADFSPNDLEKRIIKELLKNKSLVRGGVYFRNKNVNALRGIDFINNNRRSRFLSYLKNRISEAEYTSYQQVRKVTACPYKMDKKSKMLCHWPTFDRNKKDVILSVASAYVWFKNGRITVKAANDMNFDIYSGETFGLVGESGSGKTTISRAILGINKLAKGAIYWKGNIISSGLSKKEQKAVKKDIQMIFQDPAASLNERANIDYIVSEGLYSFKICKSREERLTKVQYMMRQVGLLPEHLSRYPHEFSGGQRQRIGIARALVIEPQLVLADEPISALDVSIRAQVLNLLRRLQSEQNLTYLFIAHDLSIIRYISDRIAVMHNGYIVELGSAEEIYNNPLHPYTKSLLTAIPQPDPRSKNERVKIAYDQGENDYATNKWKEYTPGHLVLVNEEIDSLICKQLKK